MRVNVESVEDGMEHGIRTIHSHVNLYCQRERPGTLEVGFGAMKGESKLGRMKLYGERVPELWC